MVPVHSFKDPIIWFTVQVTNLFLTVFRSIMISMTSVDVPVLYAPVPFENASISAPEVGQNK